KISERVVTNTGAPVYTYISDADIGRMTDVGSYLVNDIYPLNEYLMANEVYIESDAGIIYDGEIIRVEEHEGISGEINTEAESNTTDLKETETNESVQGVISRNAIKGTVYDKTTLSDYAFSKKFYTVTGITSLTKEIFRPGEFLNKDLSIKKESSKPQILIFHTHSQETFVDSVANDPATSIVGVGAYLAKILSEKYGYNVIHDTSVYDLVDGKLDRSKAYTYSQAGIEKILRENPTIEVVIDLHRDGVPDNLHLATEVDDKNVAKLMFFNGISYTNVNGNISYLNNPYRDDNLAMSLQMFLMGEAYYPGLLRNNYINAYRYCLHNRGRSMLIEAGAQTNTFNEVKYAMEPLADMLNKVLSGQKVY
ncbi:MAG: stage II sporulation protein P, partial [Lachnospira sp.]|nr:stage II sporulation protein P [Lachnospira sp.]